MATSPLRDFPVLFHLMDVSRPKGYAAAPPPHYMLGSAESSSKSDPGIETGGEAAASSAFDLATAVGLVKTKGYGGIPEPPILPGALSPAEDPLPESVSDGTSNIVADGSTDSIAAPPIDETVSPSGLETPPPASADEAVSPRQRAEERQRKRQAAKGEDWFNTQGKFIAVGFVLALIVTIYAARTGRKTNPPPVASKPNAHPRAGSHSVPAKVPASRTTASPVVAITNVSPALKSDSGEPQAALHPPTIPTLAQQQKKAGEESLFPVVKQEERLAIRTEERQASVPASELPVATQKAAPPASPPAMQPQYPQTTYGGEYQRAAPPAVHPSVAPPQVPSGGPAARPMPSYPTTNSARGSRYERTGSGLY
jgi:hypothetical protein